MKFLVIVLCLLSERYLVHSLAKQRFSWFGAYSQYVSQLVEGYTKNSWVVFIAIIAPLTILVGFTYWLTYLWIYGLVGFFLSLFLFYYCLGPNNAFYPVIEDMTLTHEHEAAHYLSQVNKELFSVVFWYLLVGPAGIVAYRVIALCVEDAFVGANALAMVNIMEWVPARLTALFYLLVGNFQKGVATYLRWFFSAPSHNKQFLQECGFLALATSDRDEPSIAAAENMVEYATVLMLVLMALITIALCL